MAVSLPNLRVVRVAPDRWTVERLVYVGPLYDELVTVGHIQRDGGTWRGYYVTGTFGDYRLTDDGIPFSSFEDAVLKLAHHTLPDEPHRR